MKRPLVIIAYNRPEYFEPVLKSLQPQVEDDRKVLMFLDGVRKHFGKEFEEADAKGVSECKRLFEYYLPNGECIESKKNLGVAFNQLRARETVFQDHEEAIFLEDDAVLEPYYISQLDRLMDFFRDDPRVGMVNGFGEGHRDKELYESYPYIKKDEGSKEKTTSYLEQEMNKNRFKGMDHLWAYGFYRRAYEKVKETMMGYYALIPDHEYRARPHDKIMQFWRNKGSSNGIVSSQDSGTATALILNDFIKVSTYTNNFTYIGVWGEHSRPDNFDNAGWNDCITYDREQLDFTWDDETFNCISSRLKNKYTAERAYESFRLDL